MTRIAAGSESTDVEDWMPSKVYLSVPLMWTILQFDCMAGSRDISSAGLLHGSLAPAVAEADEGDEGSTLEIIVASSPEINIDTADGGQTAPSMSYKTPNSAPSAAATASTSASSSSARPHVGHHDMAMDQPDTLTFNTTPWLYADPSHFVNIPVGDMGYQDSQHTVDTRGMAWWEGDNFSNPMFSHF